MNCPDRKKQALFPLMLAASLLVTPFSAMAQETGHSGNDTPRKAVVQERAGAMADRLNPALQKFDPRAEKGPRMQRIIAVDAGREYGVVADMWRKIILSLHFTPGSDTLLPKARKLLEDVGTALEELNETRRQFLVIGHTDATGDNISNQRLSVRRANTVRTYLVNNFNIKPHRLLVSGLGEDMPLYKDTPKAEINRRVEIVLVDRVLKRGKRPGNPASYTSVREKSSSRVVCKSYRGKELRDIRPQHMDMDDYDARTPVTCAQ